MSLIKLAGTSLHWPEWNSHRSFNLGVGVFSIYLRIPGVLYRSFPVWPFNAFRRVFADPTDNCWGFGLLQVSSRHLLYVGNNGEQFNVDVAFVHVVRRVHRQAGAAA